MKLPIDLVLITAGSQGIADKMHVPLGLLYIGTRLKQHGYAVTIHHVLPFEIPRCIEAISGNDPLWVGISVLSGMTTHYAAKLSKELRLRIPHVPLVWGGHHPSAAPEECLAEPFVDFVVIGEGEETAVELSEALRRETSPSLVRGLGFKTTERRVVINEPRQLEEDLDKYELDWDLVDMNAYRWPTPRGAVPVSFYSSRGCAYDCAFCATPRYSGRRFRSHSVTYVVRSIRYLHDRFGFTGVYFGDDNFMTDVTRATEIIRQLAQAGITVDTLDLRVNQINESCLAAFKDYGVRGIFFGYESGNDRLLTMMNKRIRLDDIKAKTLLIAKYGISTWASGIICVPTETRAETYATIDFSQWLRDNLPRGSTAAVFRFMPLPGTKMLDIAVSEGFRRPRSAEEWRKIDPLGPYYSSKEWIPWLTGADEHYLVFAQEMSRNKILDRIRHLSAPIRLAKELFSWRAKVQIARRKGGMRCILFLYGLSVSIYSRLVTGRSLYRRSEAFSRTPPHAVS